MIEDRPAPVFEGATDARAEDVTSVWVAGDAGNQRSMRCGSTHQGKGVKVAKVAPGLGGQ